MFVHPQFNPIAIQLGPVAIRWYGLMYLVAFIVFIILGRYRARKDPQSGWKPQDIDNLLLFGVFGVILGGRLGYVLFYKPSYYLDHLSEILAVWQGGMSFHGGFIGVLVAIAVYARIHHKSWLSVTDFIAPLIPLGIAAGRLGNFINGELWGRATNVPWAIIFPQVDAQPRHPSQLYQFGLEGLTLFILLWWYSAKARPTGAVSAVFLIGYGSLRFIAEFAREPDYFLGLLFLNFSMGQWLSLPMVLVGLLLLFWAYGKRTRHNN